MSAQHTPMNDGSGLKTWRVAAAPIKSFSSYLGKKRSRVRGASVNHPDDHPAVGGSAVAAIQAPPKHLQHQKWFDDDSDNDDDEEHLVTAMHHGHDDDHDETDSVHENYLQDETECKPDASEMKSSSRNPNQHHHPERKKIPSRSGSGMLTAMRHFLTNTNNRFGKRKEKESFNNNNNVSEEIKTSIVGSTTSATTTGTNSTTHDPSKSSLVMDQPEHSSFSSCTKTTSTSAPSPHASPAQSSERNSSLPSSSSILAQNSSLPKEDDAVKTVPSQDNNSLHSMTVQQVMMEPSTHSRSGSIRSYTNKSTGRFESSNITVKMSNQKGPNDDATVSEYLQFQLNADRGSSNAHDPSTRPVAVSPHELHQQQLQEDVPPAPKQTVSIRSTGSPHYDTKVSSRRRPSMARTHKASATSENDASSSVRPMKHRSFQNGRSLSQKCEDEDASDPPIQSLERIKQRSTRKLLTFVDNNDDAVSSNGLGRKSSTSRSSRTLLDRKSSTTGSRSSRTLHTYTGEGSDAITTPIKSLSSPFPRRVKSLKDKSSIQVDPIISPRQQQVTRRIQSVESGLSSARVRTDRMYRCKRTPSDVDVMAYHKTPSKEGAGNENLSMLPTSTTSSMLSQVKAPELSQEGEESSPLHTEETLLSRSKSSRSCHAASNRKKFRQESFRSTVSRSKNSDSPSASLPAKERNHPEETSPPTPEMSMSSPTVKDEDSILRHNIDSREKYQHQHRSRYHHSKEAMTSPSAGTTKTRRQRSKSQVEMVSSSFGNRVVSAEVSEEMDGLGNSSHRNRCHSSERNDRPVVSSEKRALSLDRSLSSRGQSLPRGAIHNPKTTSTTTTTMQKEEEEEEEQRRRRHHHRRRSVSPVQRNHLRKKVHQVRSEDVWLTRTPTPAPTKSLTVADLRKMSYSDGRMREKYVPGRRTVNDGSSSITIGGCGRTTPKSLEAPFLDDTVTTTTTTPSNPSRLRRGTRSGHSSTAAGAAAAAAGGGGIGDSTSGGTGTGTGRSRNKREDHRGNRRSSSSPTRINGGASISRRRSDRSRSRSKGVTLEHQQYQ